MNNPGDLEDDELISAYLDDEVSPAERLRVETDPALAERAREMASVVLAPGSPSEALTDGDRDRFVAAALTAWRDQQATDSPTDSPTSSASAISTGPIDLSVRRRNRLAMSLSAAAVVALLAMSASVAVRLMSRGSDSSVQSTAAGGFEAGSATGDDAALDDADASMESASRESASESLEDSHGESFAESAARSGVAAEAMQDAASDDDAEAIAESADESAADEPAIAPQDGSTTTSLGAPDDESAGDPADEDQATTAQMAALPPRDIGVVVSPAAALAAVLDADSLADEVTVPADDEALASWLAACAPLVDELEVLATARLATTDLVVVARSNGDIAPAGSVVALSGQCEILDTAG